MQNGRLPESLDALKVAYAFFRKSENGWEQANAASFLAMIQIELGNYQEGIRLATEAVELARAVEHPHLTMLYATLGFAHRSILSLDVAQEAYMYIYSAVAGGEGFYPFPDETPAELCAIHALRGEWDEAYPYAKEVLVFHTGGSLPPMGKTGWFETEALLRGGDGDLARAEVARLDKAVGTNRRYRLPLLRSKAVLAQWDGAPDQAIAHLGAALALARAIGLPGEEWPILAALGALHLEQGEQDQAQQAYQAAAAIIGRLAGTFDDSDLRARFLAADPVRTVLAVRVPTQP
jgi:tetratricopeptide (TPR) repeat protein